MPPATQHPPLHVEIALDLTCVHSCIGFARFERAADRHRAAGHVLDVAFLPFQVTPDAPAGGVPLDQVHLGFFGGRAEMERARSAMAAVGAGAGLDLRFDRAVHVNTFEAHRLLARAAAQGLGEAMAERLFRAYLTDGLNIGERATLDRLAAETGVRPGEDPDEAERLRDRLARTRGLGIRSVPVFRIGAATVTGAQDEDVFDRALTAALA
ncbi:DsbA family protein [Streptomyces sp. Edi4]|uniref:DsbA family oxidoreductase n=1 Tax=Streptomyces sp. Edi4 TaxID=3162527 RepID=UPI0033062F3E